MRVSDDGGVMRMGAESGLRRRVKGLSEAEFRQRFGTEAQCRAALFQLRWGKGWACPGCAHCRLCRAQGPGGLPVQPLQAPGRADRRDGVPLDQTAADHLVPGDLPSEPSKGGMSSVELARRLGTRQPTAWLIKHKLMAAMAGAGSR